MSLNGHIAAGGVIPDSSGRWIAGVSTNLGVGDLLFVFCFFGYPEIPQTLFADWDQNCDLLPNLTIFKRK